MIRTIGLGLLTGLWGLVVFIVALHVHFPEQALLERIRYEVQNGSKDDWALTAEGAAPWRLTGVTLQDATLYSVERPKPKRRGRMPTSDEEVEDPITDGPTLTPVLRAESASVRLALFPLLQNRRVVSYDLDLYGGGLSGQIGVDGAERPYSARGDGIDLSRIPFEGRDWSVDAAGQLIAEIDLLMNNEEMKSSAGEVHFEIEDFVIESAQVMGITIDRVPFTEAVLDIEVDGGKAVIQKGHFASEPLTIDLDGDITLSKDFRRTRMRIAITLTLSEEYDRFAKLSPQMKKARDDDGVYHFVATGSLTKPRLREDKTRSGASGGAPQLSSEDHERRRQERLDRLRERREAEAADPDSKPKRSMRRADRAPGDAAPVGPRNRRPIGPNSAGLPGIDELGDPMDADGFDQNVGEEDYIEQPLDDQQPLDDRDQFMDDLPPDQLDEPYLDE